MQRKAARHELSAEGGRRGRPPATVCTTLFGGSDLRGTSLKRVQGMRCLARQTSPSGCPVVCCLSVVLPLPPSPLLPPPCSNQNGVKGALAGKMSEKVRRPWLCCCRRRRCPPLLLPLLLLPL